MKPAPDKMFMFLLVLRFGWLSALGVIFSLLAIICGFYLGLVNSGLNNHILSVAIILTNAIALFYQCKILVGLWDMSKKQWKLVYERRKQVQSLEELLTKEIDRLEAMMISDKKE